jgi:hypothetical protein
MFRFSSCVGVLALLPAIAVAGVPTPPGVPGNCSAVPARIVLVGTAAGVPDTQLGEFEVVVCRFGSPYFGTVAVTNSPEPHGVHIGLEADPTQQAASCANPYVRAFADGSVRMTVTGAVELASQVPGVAPTVRIYAEGVLFGDVPVVCYDLDGAGGVGANDLALWLQLFGSGQDWLVADYNDDGRVGAGDLSLWLAVFGSGRQSSSATPFCP